MSMIDQHALLSTERNTALNSLTPLGACAASLAGETGIDVVAEGLCRRPSIQGASRRESADLSNSRRVSLPAALHANQANHRASFSLQNNLPFAKNIEEHPDEHNKSFIHVKTGESEPTTPRNDATPRASDFSRAGSMIGSPWHGQKKGIGPKGHRIYTVSRDVAFDGQFEKNNESVPGTPVRRSRGPQIFSSTESDQSSSHASSATLLSTCHDGSVSRFGAVNSAATKLNLDRQSTLLPSPKLFGTRLGPIASPGNSPRATPTLLKLDGKLLSTGPAISLPSTPKTRLDSFAPSWSLRYAELIGSAPDDAVNVKAAKTKASAPSPQHSPAAPSAVTESVYLAKFDKRLPKLSGRRSKPSRLKARRTALSLNTQSVLKVAVAVRKAWKDHPGHMRRLNKALEEMVGKGQVLKVESKSIENNRLQQLSESTGIHDEEISSLFESFHRYDIDDSGFLDRNEVRQVLFDLGLQPRSQEEKVEVNEIMCDLDLEGLSQYSFEQFLTMVKCVRERLRQTQLGECMALFEEADQNDNKVLGMIEVMTVLDIRLGLAARTEDERHELQVLFGQCDRDGDGEVNFEEFQNFVQLARAKLMMIRREEELTIAKAFQLNSTLINEFRMDLPVLWELFNRYDLEGKSRVSKADLQSLLIDIGLAPWRPQPGDEKAATVQSVHEMLGQKFNDFPHVLTIVKMIRSKLKAGNQKDLQTRFHLQDRYGYGELEMSEIYPILECFEMLPRTRDEQLNILNVVERLDTDGSGTFCFTEFEDFFQRLTEQVQYLQREQERTQVMALGFGENQLQTLRQIFYSLNPSTQGRIGQIGLVSAINRARETLLADCYLDEARVRDITRTAQQYPDHMIDFLEFSATLKQITTNIPQVVDEHLSAPTAHKLANES